MAPWLNRFFGPYLGLPSSLYTVYSATVINRFGDFVFPFLALYLTQVRKMDPGAAGVVVSTAFASATLGALVSGRLADRWGRKRTLVLVQGISGFLMGAVGLCIDSAFALPLIVLALFLRGAARPLLSALITDLTPPGRRKESFALQYWSINVGVSVGPLAAAFLFRHSIPLLFLGDALTTLISAGLLAGWVKVPQNQSLPQESGREDHDGQKALKAFFNRPLLWIYGVLMFINSVVYAQGSFSLPLQAEQVAPGSGPEIFGALLSLNAVTVLIFSLPLSRLLKSWPPLVCVAAAGLLYSLGFGMMAFGLPVFGLYVATLVWTLGEILHSTNSGVYIVRHTPVNWRGSFQSFLGFFSQGGHAVSPLVFGWILGSWGMGWVWMLVGALALVQGASSFWLWTREKEWDRDLQHPAPASQG